MPWPSHWLYCPLQWGNFLGCWIAADLETLHTSRTDRMAWHLPVNLSSTSSSIILDPKCCNSSSLFVTDVLYSSTAYPIFIKFEHLYHGHHTSSIVLSGEATSQVAEWQQTWKPYKRQEQTEWYGIFLSIYPVLPRL